MYFANKELKELNESLAKKGSGGRLGTCYSIHQHENHWKAEKVNNPTAYSLAMWTQAFEMNMWPFKGRLWRSIPVIQNDPLCMDVESARKYEEAMNLVTTRVYKVLPRSIRLDSGNGKVSFTHLFSEMLKVTNSVKPNPEAKPKKLIPGYYGDNYISPNLVYGLTLDIDKHRFTPGFLQVKLSIGMYQIPYYVVEKSDRKLGAHSLHIVGRRPYGSMLFGNIYEVVFQIRPKELNPMLRDFATFVSSASTYTFNNLNYVDVYASGYELKNHVVPIFIKALQASPSKAFSNAGIDPSCTADSCSWGARVNAARQFPNTIK